MVQTNTFFNLICLKHYNKCTRDLYEISEMLVSFTTVKFYVSTVQNFLHRGEERNKYFVLILYYPLNILKFYSLHKTGTKIA